MFKTNYRPGVAEAYRQQFVAQITDAQVGKAGGQFAGKYVYSWVEQFLDPETATYIDGPSPRSGIYKPTGGAGGTELISNPALEVDETYIAPGAYVLLTYAGFIGDLQLYNIVDSTPVVFVKTTSGTADANGWYPARLQEWSAKTQTWVQQPRFNVLDPLGPGVPGTCLIKDCNGAALANGVRYLGVFSSFVFTGGVAGREGWPSYICQATPVVPGLCNTTITVQYDSSISFSGSTITLTKNFKTYQLQIVAGNICWVVTATTSSTSTANIPCTTKTVVTGVTCNGDGTISVTTQTINFLDCS